MRTISTDAEGWAALLALAAGDGGASPTGPSAFWDLYEPLARPRGGTFVLAQLAQSLDGRIATPTGHSHYVSGPESLVHLHRCRALLDAVVVGAGTAIADDPQLTVRHVAGPSPARVVIDPRGRVPAGSKAFRDDGCRRVVVQAEPVPRPPGVEALTLPARDGRIPEPAILEALAGMGLRRILVEGGGHTVAGFVAARLVDRLHLGIAPLIIGSGPVGLCLPPIERLDSALRPASAVYGLGGDVLFDCAFVP